MRVWDVDRNGKGSSELECKGHSDTVERIVWNPSSSDQFVSAGGDGDLRFWDARTGKCLATVALGDECVALTWARPQSAAQFAAQSALSAAPLRSPW